MPPDFTHLRSGFSSKVSTAALKSDAGPSPSNRSLPSPGEILGNLKQGERVSAQVLELKNASQAQRQQLISNNIEQILGTRPTADNQRQELAKLPSPLQQILLSPKLQLVALKLLGNPLLTFTDQPLKPGQALTVTKGPQGQLQLNTTTPEQTLARVSDALKHTLPKYADTQNIAQQLKGLNRLQQLLALQLAQPTANTQGKSPPPQAPLTTLNTALQNIGKAFTDLSTLTSPTRLKATLNQQVGVLMESKLAPLIPAAMAGRGVQNSSPNTVLAGLATPTNNLSGMDAKALQDLQHNLKVLLLTGLNITTPLTPPTLQTSTSTLDQALAKLLAPLLQQATTPTLPTKASVEPEQLLALIHRQLQKTLGKVQLQQLQSLSKRFQTGDASASQFLQFELPVRQGAEQSSIAIHINERWQYSDAEEQAQDTQTPTTEKTKQWQVKLVFELPQAGKFHAHLNITDDQVSASLWAESSATHQLASTRLNELEQRLTAEGLRVQTLDCFAGAPATESVQLQYNLVDIKT